MPTMTMEPIATTVAGDEPDAMPLGAEASGDSLPQPRSRSDNDAMGHGHLIMINC